jgi:hypothetical protein
MNKVYNGVTKVTSVNRKMGLHLNVANPNSAYLFLLFIISLVDFSFRFVSLPYQ